MNTNGISRIVNFAPQKRQKNQLMDDLSIQLRNVLEDSISLKVGTTIIRPMNSKINVHQAANGEVA